MREKIEILANENDTLTANLEKRLVVFKLNMCSVKVCQICDTIQHKYAIY